MAAEFLKFTNLDDLLEFKKSGVYICNSMEMQNYSKGKYGMDIEFYHSTGQAYGVREGCEFKAPDDWELYRPTLKLSEVYNG